MSHVLKVGRSSIHFDPFSEIHHVQVATHRCLVVNLILESVIRSLVFRLL